MSVRCSGEEGGTHGTHRTHGTVADGTKGLTCSPSHASRQRSVGILGGETAKQNLPSAELRDGTRDSVLALKSTRSPLHQRTLAEYGYVPVRRSEQDCATRGNIHRFIASANPSYSGKNLRSKVFHCVRVERICKISVLALKIHTGLHAGSPARSAPPRTPNSSERSERNCKPWRSHTHMLCRCVGFLWAKPSVTKSSTHLLVFLVLKLHAVLHMQSCGVVALFEYFVYFPALRARAHIFWSLIHMQSFTCFAEARFQ